MPQLDKTSPVYTNTQYEGGGEDIINRRTSTSDVKKVKFCVVIFKPLFLYFNDLDFALHSATKLSL